MGAERGILGLNDHRDGSVSVGPVAVGMDLGLVAKWTQEFGATDPLAHPSDRDQESGTIKHFASLVDYEQFRATSVYRDWLVPAGLCDLVAATLSDEGPAMEFIGVYRGDESGPFDESGISAMTALAPHLQRAARLNQRLSRLERRTRITEGALDQLRSSVVVVDQSGKVEYANRAASELLAEEDGLAIREGKLSCANPEATLSLRSHLQDSLEHAAGNRPTAGGVVPMARPSGRRTLGALVTPISSRARDGLGFGGVEASAALVVVSDPSWDEETSEPVLRELFHLTSAEARVTWALARGLSVEEIAEQANVAISTVRSQLKQILDKTGTRRQAELVSLVLRSLAPLRG